MALRKISLRFQSRLYVRALVLLGAFSVPLISGCGNAKDAEAELKRLQDSITSAKHTQDSIALFKADSVATAIKEKAIQDSIALANAPKPPKPPTPPKPPKPTIPPNPPTTKYGVPANLRNN